MTRWTCNPRVSLVKSAAGDTRPSRPALPATTLCLVSACIRTQVPEVAAIRSAATVRSASPARKWMMAGRAEVSSDSCSPGANAKRSSSIRLRSKALAEDPEPERELQQGDQGSPSMHSGVMSFCIGRWYGQDDQRPAEWDGWLRVLALRRNRPPTGRQPAVPAPPESSQRSARFSWSTKGVWWATLDSNQ